MAKTTVPSQYIADNAVTTAKIAANAITAAQIAGGAIVSVDLGDNSITVASIAGNAVGSSEIAANAVGNSEIAANAVDSAEIVSGSIDTAHLSADAVDGTKIADDSIDSEHYVDGSIDTAHIGDSQVTNAKLANSSVTVNSNSLSLGGTLTLDTDDIGEGSTNLYFTNARAQSAISAGTGITVSSGEISIAGNAITATMIAANAVGSSEIAANSVDSAEIAANAVSTSELASTAAPTFASITTTGNGDIGGNLTVTGNLQVDGTTTTINSTNLEVDDLNITVAAGAANAAAADGAGLTVDGASATFTYGSAADSWASNKPLTASKSLTLGASGTNTTYIEVGSSTTDNHFAFIDLIGDTTYTDYGLRLIRGDGGANTSSQLLHRGTGNLDIATLDAASLRLITNNTPAITIDSSQNATFAGNIDASGILYIGSESKRLSTDGNGELGIGYNQTASNYIFTVYNGTTPTLRVDAAGEVGIGVTSPSAPLDVSGGSLGTTSGNEITHTTIGGSRHHLDFKEIRTANANDWNSTTFRLQGRVDTTDMASIDFVTDASFNRHLHFNTASNSTKMVILHGGNVGIGTTDPDALLHVEGVARTKYLRFQNLADATSEVAGMYSSSGGGTNDLTIYASALSSTSSNIKFLTAPTNSATTTTLFLEGSSGNVGIGTNSPVGPLEIYAAEPRIHLNRENAFSWNIWVGNGTTFTNSYFNIAEGTTSKFAIAHTTGNVGIENTGPTSKLHLGNSSTSGGLGLGIQNNSRYYTINTDGGDLIVKDESAGAWRFRIESDGTVVHANAGSIERIRNNWSQGLGSYTAGQVTQMSQDSSYRHAAYGMYELGTVTTRGFGNYVDFKTNLTSDNIMFMFYFTGYQYNRGTSAFYGGGYTYTNNSVIAKDTGSGSIVVGPMSVYELYRSSSGNLCVKLHCSVTGYDEGRVNVFFMPHGSGFDTMRIIDAHVTNSTTNYY